MDDQPRSASWDVRIAESRADRDRVFRFRYESHIAEYGRWPTSGMRDRKILREVADEGATLLFVEWERRIAATLRLQIGPIAPDLRAGLQASRFRKMAPNELAVADQIVIARALRRTTLLGDLLRAAEDESRCRGAAILLCHARDDQAHFYTGLGFRFYAPGFPILEQGTRYPLVKAVAGTSSDERLAALLSDSPTGAREPVAARRP
jgi:hypothetical protein